MRTLEYGATQHVPAFLTKLWKLVTDTSCDDLISWSVAGTSFIIYDEIRFSKELLPLYFKHNNMASFVRQLNMYGFRKLSCIDQGGMHSYKNEIEFYHQYFLKGQASLLEQIKRKIPTSKSDEPKVRQEYINELITNIKSLRGKQDSAEQGLRSLRRENKMLWRHVSLLTERYSKQQAVLQQLVPFFVKMVRPSRTVSQLKRKAPLMIDEGVAEYKIACRTPPYFVEHDDQSQSSGLPSSPGNVSNRGPVIHDVTEMEGSKMFAENLLCSANTTKEPEVIVDSPLSNSIEGSDTMDSPYTDPGQMETFNILNSSFEREAISPQMKMSQSSTTMPTSPILQQFSPGSPPVIPIMSPSSSTCVIPPISIHDETTCDVSLLQNTLRNQFVPKVESYCSDSGYYSLNCGVNEGASSSQSTNIAPENFAMPTKLTDSELNWMMSQAYSSTEPNLENWLGQIIKSDNLAAGCSLPQVPPQNMQQI